VPAVNLMLAAAGMVLFLLGLINGLIIGFGRSPRLLLSAHLTGVQSGTFLIAVGLLWPHIAMPVIWAGWLSVTLTMSLFGLWLALLLAGLVGAGRGLPIAGGGIETKPLYQLPITALLCVSIAGALVATAGITFWMLT
jgi:(hydroxyamino)benzene mutase